MVDLMLAFTPDPFVEVHSFVGNSFWNHDVEDNAHAIMRTASGVVAMLHSSATLWKHTFSLEVSLTRATLRLSGILSGTKSYGDERLTLIHREDETNGLPTEHITTYVQDRSWDEELESFVRCIVQDLPVDVGNSTAALASMELVHRIYQADSSWADRAWSSPETAAASQPGPAEREP
jgi:predicted dehydrogenase